MGKPLAGAFVVGGLYGVLVHIVFLVWNTITPGSDFVMAFTLISCGFIMMLLYICGIVQILEKYGGFGAIIPLIGLVSGTAAPTNNIRKEAKLPLGKAFSMAAKPPVIMLVIGAVSTLLLSFIVCAIKKTPEFPIVSPDPTTISPVVGIIVSFIVMGVIGAVGQYFLMMLKPDVAGVMKMLLCGFFIGNFISWFGLGQYLGTIAIGGFNVPILGAGELMFTSVFLGMKLGIWEATIIRTITFIIIVSSMFLFGIVGAAIRGSMKPDEIK